MKKYLFGLLLFFSPLFVSAQKPYWQQEVNYKIDVSLNDQQHELTATETIEYINNSPDELSFIYFHLWPNAYKNRKTAFAKQQLVNKSRKFHFADKSSRGFIDGLDFKVNGEAVKIEPDAEHPDIVKLVLNQPLRPGERITITTPFRVKLPDSFSRLGHVEQSYQVTQWYPKPAVYDHKGWHPMPYLDQGEFYSEFGSFDVSITLPANYTVGATGVLQNPQEQARLDSLAEATAAKSSFDKQDMAFPASSSQTKTLRYVQDRVHDFAWFADKRFNVLKSEVELPQSRRKVTTWLMFLNVNAEEWLKKKQDINDAVYYYSLWVGDYPYAHATAVDGALSAGAGMEYPMVTVTIPDAIIHEVGHNWFYGILGSNERVHPWQDEGMNSYIENRIAQRDNANAGHLGFVLQNHTIKRLFGLHDLNANAVNYLAYQMGASRGLDQPVELQAEDYRSINYGTIVYMKTSVLFQYLAGYLGQSRFDSCMHAYYERWKFRHPYPEDLQAVFEQVSGEDLSWFFRDMLRREGAIDAELEDARQLGGSWVVTVENNNTIPYPVPVAALNEQGQVLEVQWTKPFTGEQQLTFSTPGVHSFQLDPEYLLPETNRSNNMIRTSGILRKQEKLRLQFLAGVEQPKRRQLFFTPVIGANTSDKFMLGLALTNSTLVQKRVSYFLMPMYSFNQKEVNGMYDLNLALPHFGPFRQVKLGGNFHRFVGYERSRGYLRFDFKQGSRTAPSQRLELMYTYVDDDAFRPYYLLYQPRDWRTDTKYWYHVPSVRYAVEMKNAVQEAGMNLGLSWYKGGSPVFAVTPQEDQQALLAQATLLYKRHLTRSKEVRLRLYGGGFLGDTDKNQTFVLGLSGSPDYQKETIFLDRIQTSHFYTGFEHQTDGRDGGFKSLVPVFTNQWLVSANGEIDIPRTPFTLFGDAGYVRGVNEAYYGTGLAMSFFGGVLRLYLPVAGSNYADTTPESLREFRNNIRFSLHLNALSPFKLLEDNL